LLLCALTVIGGKIEYTIIRAINIDISFFI